MNAHELFREGRLDEAITTLSAELRSNPTDAQRRTFLFELLCFSGNYERAEKQLDVLAQDTPDAGRGALLYRSAMHAEEMRQQMFRTGQLPSPTSAGSVSGTLNGGRFASLEDADPRIGPRLEMFAAGQYTWLPFEHVETVTIDPPTRARDLLWAPAVVRPGRGFEELELGEVLLPVMAPLTSEHADDAVKLGRVTEWQPLNSESAAPIGQKLWLVDGEEFPFLEVRELAIDPAP